MIKKKILWLALLAFVILLPIFKPSHVMAAATNQTYTLNVCVKKTSDLFGDGNYTIGQDDSVNMMMYKKSISAKNILTPATYLSRSATWDDSNCQIYAGTISVSVDIANDRPIILNVEVPVKTPGGVWKIVKATKTYPMFIDVALGDMEIDVDVSKANLTAITSSSIARAPDGYRLFPELSCGETTALTCYTNRIFSFTQVAVLLLSIGAFVVAGIIYMTSGGNPKRIESAKKIMIGALSAIAVVVLGRFFLTNIIGIKL